jgi:hypothetical protein
MLQTAFTQQKALKVEPSILTSLPFTVELACSKLQEDSTQYGGSESKVKQFELINHLKKEFSDINSGFTQTEEF